MPDDRWQRVKDLVDAALERPAEAREAFLREACGDDGGLRGEVESLLAARREAGDFLSEPVRVEETAARSVPASSARLAIGTRLGPYEVVSFLGAGGMGEVYKARDTRLEREVALKVLPSGLATDRERCRRFEQEARAASALNHPNIITVHEVGEFEGKRFIVMELVAGRTLREQDVPLPLEHLLAVGEQVARALAAAHAAGIVHRDIKPENIMVRDDGYVKVLDFGLARLARERPAAADSSGASLTRPGMLLGTARYMSPEQVRGEPVLSATDVFSCGIVLYEVASGRHPFMADLPVEILHAILSQDPLPVSLLNPEIPPPLDALILSMLEKDPRRRPTAAEVVPALAGFAGGRPAAAGRPVAPPAKRRTVGRERERTDLWTAFDAAASGEGRLVCVTGEPGIGKTTVVEDFLAELRASGRPCAIARGRCSERLAGAEAYLPILEALDSLLRGATGESAVRALKLLGPTWYAQIAPTVAEEAHAARAGSQAHLKREFGGFLQEACRLHPLVLFLDDVHWADPSTTDLLAYVATKFAVLKILVLATYRPSELRLGHHPFLTVKLDLQARGACREIPLDFLRRGDIEAYLALEFPGHRFEPRFVELIHEKTEGSPLFMVDLVRWLRARGVITEEGGRWVLAGSVPQLERELPESVRSMIQRKIDQVSEEDRRLMMAAAVQGYECDSAVLAGALGGPAADVEERLDALETVHAFVRRVREEELPDGTLTLRYRFVHVLYQNTLYASLTPARRASLSAAVAGALLEHFGERRATVAAQLASLFEAARDFSRAADYFLLAARNAGRVFAYREAVALAERGLEVLRRMPEGPDRTRREMELEIALGGLAIVTRAGADPEVERHYLRARELGELIGDSPELFTALRGLSEFNHESGQLEAAVALAEQALAVAERLADPTLVVDAHHAVAMPLLYLGRLSAALEHLNEGVRLYVPERSRAGALYQAIDPGVGCRYQRARTLWLLGYPDQALADAAEGMALARQLGHDYSLAQIHVAAALVHQFRREPAGTRERSEIAIAMAQEHGFEQVLALAGIFRAWALAAKGRGDEAVTQMRENLAAAAIVAYKAMRPHLLALLAEVLAGLGRLEEALATTAEALATTETGGRYYKAEVLRLTGELLLAQATAGQTALGSEAEACFAEATDVARGQSAKSLELRAAISRDRLWRAQGRTDEAVRILAETYGWFTEGLETEDLKEARRLIEDRS